MMNSFSPEITFLNTKANDCKTLKIWNDNIHYKNKGRLNNEEKSYLDSKRIQLSR